jgi:hypothetical protein
MALEGIRTVETKKDAIGNYEQVRVVFGPHYFIELHCERNGNGAVVERKPPSVYWDSRSMASITPPRPRAS